MLEARAKDGWVEPESILWMISCADRISGGPPRTPRERVGPVVRVQLIMALTYSNSSVVIMDWETLGSTSECLRAKLCSEMSCCPVSLLAQDMRMRANAVLRASSTSLLLRTEPKFVEAKLSASYRDLTTVSRVSGCLSSQNFVLLM